jgi:hypothetical protein
MKESDMARTKSLAADPEPVEVFTEGTYSPEPPEEGAGVTIYPTEGAYIPGVPAVEQEVDQATADALLAYSPPAFTTDPAEARPEVNPLEAPAPEEPAVEEPVVPAEG